MPEQTSLELIRKTSNSPLTSRQTQCLYWASIGKTSREMGQILTISESTANYHVREACTKLGVHSRQAGIVKAMSAGYLPHYNSKITD
ncbi:response regulator transcription factor [Neopusillimonas maritima]|jgi:DNA-binding CsgD family transcriptional regulator|uniref:HTH luxR-type domain-containing protein n=1 Tax=Neopusillimonas maritima TaxID=2026239 RepID=A0A3A1YVC9_9BURK|nr:helix-turn-helix transcriptional regulator [Neopusillimonas maritima]RII81866.1 hypothetical protein CJO09_13970 [Neopusillimonas maritima]RIY40414.1 hypothetical protein CJP73_11160 [Neopusillimonas maritima]|tara:strand:- start:6183 stop:6446 length:264 start_codon:yes stop_codon:yes gene_type:complete